MTRQPVKCCPAFSSCPCCTAVRNLKVKAGGVVQNAPRLQRVCCAVSGTPKRRCSFWFAFAEPQGEPMDGLRHPVTQVPSRAFREFLPKLRSISLKTNTPLKSPWRSCFSIPGSRQHRVRALVGRDLSATRNCRRTQPTLGLEAIHSSESLRLKLGWPCAPSSLPGC